MNAGRVEGALVLFSLLVGRALVFFASSDLAGELVEGLHLCRFSEVFHAPRRSSRVRRAEEHSLGFVSPLLASKTAVVVLLLQGALRALSPLRVQCQNSAPEWHCSIFLASSIPSGRKR